MALLLEKRGLMPKKVILLDGSHNFVSSFTMYHKQRLLCGVGPKLETESLCAFVSQCVHSLQNKVSVKSFSAFHVFYALTVKK